MESSFLGSLSDCVVLIQAKRKLRQPRTRKNHAKVQRNQEVIYGSGYEVVSTAREFNKTFMALESHEQEAVGDAGEPSRKKQQGNTNKERSSVAKHDHASKSQGGATQGPRGGGSLAGGAGGGGKPPPRNNHKRNVQSKVAVSLEETDDNEELSLKKTTGKPSASSRTTKATEVTSSNKADAQPKKSGQTGTRGGSLERYRKLSKSIKESSKPYATFNPELKDKKSDEPSVVRDSTKRKHKPELENNKSQEPATESKSQEPTKPTRTVRTPPRKVPLTHRTKKSVKLKIAGEKPRNPPPSESSTNTTVATTANLSLPSTTKTSMTSMTTNVSEEKEEDTASVHWEEVKDPLEFSDSEISSDNEADDVSVAEDVDKRQLDSEWLHLHWTRPYFGKRDGVAKSQKANFPKGKDVPNEPEFLSVMEPLYRFMMVFGRFPFKLKERADKKKRFLFVKTSPQYFWFFLTTNLFGLSAGYSAYNMSKIFAERPPFTIYNDVASIEMDKFWVDGVVSTLWMCFLFVSSVSLLIDGHNVVGFFNRWLDSLELIQYNATWGLRRRLFLVFFLLFIYFGLVVADFSADLGYTRGSRGFTGLLVFDLLEDRLRLKLLGFKAARLFGLVLDIYVILSAAFMMSLIGAHAWSLDIAARRFNLRLGLSLRTLFFKKPEDVPSQFRKLVPFHKLFSEFLILSTFPKLMGQAFAIVLNSFCVFIMFGIVATCYAVYSTMLLADFSIGDRDFNVSGVQRGQFVPVKENLMPGTRFIKDISLCAGMWTVCVLFLELVRLPGATIMSGSHYVLRKGFTNCKTVFERRFVASMIYSYAPQGHSHVRPGFGVDRVFIAKFLGFTFGLFMTVFQFNPSRLELQSFMSCDSLLECRLVSLPKKLALHSSFQSHVEDNTRDIPLMKINSDKNYSEQRNVSDIFSKFPCTLSGLRPIDVKEYTETCNEIPIPSVFTAASVNGFYSRAPGCPHYSISQSDASSKKLYDCFGGLVNISNTDECGNLYLPTPSQEIHNRFSPQMPTVQLTTLTFEDSDKPETFCCFAYSGLREKDSAPDNQCNLPKGKVPRDRCQKKSAVTAKDRELLAAAFLNDKIDNLPNREFWVACLCQGLGGLPAANASWNPCKVRPEKADLSTTSSSTTITTPTTIKTTTMKTTTTTIKTSTTTIKTSTTTIKTTTTTTTTKRPVVGDCKVQTSPSFKMCACDNDPSRNITLDQFLRQKAGGSHMYQTCKEEFGDTYFGLGFTYDDPNTRQVTIGYWALDEMTRGPNPTYLCTYERDYLKNRFKRKSSLSSVTLYDCFGNIVNRRRADDCGNFELSYPNNKGEEVKPRLVEVPIEGTEYFQCCWNYFIDGFGDQPVKYLLGNGHCGIGGYEHRSDKPTKVEDIPKKSACAVRVKNKDSSCQNALKSGTNEFFVEKVKQYLNR